MDKNERKLTPAEQKRKEHFDKLCEEMEQNGYLKKDLTVSIKQANIFAVIIMLPFIVAAYILYYVVNPVISTDYSYISVIMLLPAYLLLVVLREAIHGLVWGYFAKSHFKSINFGIIWKMLTPYCTCAEPLTKWQYIIGTAMPTLILGFGLTVIAAIIGNLWLLILSVMMIFGGGGDFFIILRMLLYKSKNKAVMYYDHPYECGVVAFEKEK